MTNKKLPIGIQSFESLRRENYLYVDKTELIHDMITKGKYYFLSRPRRFGKSLLMSTVQAIFEGKKQLFDGTIGERLSIADMDDIDWESHPVLHLDLNTEKYDSPSVLTDRLNVFISECENLYGAREYEKSLGARFEGVIERAYKMTGRGVVILVDEYDKPMLHAISNSELQEEYRNILKAFYGALKSKDSCIQFALLTGVTKFGKISVFSDLNNLEDISMDKHMHDICGISEKELTTVFAPYIQELSGAEGLDVETTICKLRSMYDGYHFHHKSSGVYNPFSLLNTFKKQEFGNYWFETGTPSYLVKLLQSHDYNLEQMSTIETDADILNSIDSDSTDPIPVIYQSGYLTLKDYDPEFKIYRLGFPNQEVEEGFVKYLAPYYMSSNRVNTPFEVRNFVQDIRNGNADQFVKRLRTLFADTPYELVRDLENHYQNVIWLVSKLLGFYVKAEYHTSDGRIDLVLQTDRFCYVMEFKFDGTAQQAMQQICDKHYTLPFELHPQRIIRIGISFSSVTRNIDDYLIE